MVTYNTFQFFLDACSEDVTTVLSVSQSELNFQLQWPETPIGAVAVVQCPCESNTVYRAARRACGGDFISGGRWESPVDVACNFSDLSRQLCRSPDVCTLITIGHMFSGNNCKPSTFLFVQAETLVELTRNETVFGRLEIALTVELVEQKLMNATGNLQVCRQQHPLSFLFCVTIRTCHAILPTENGGACKMYNFIFDPMYTYFESAYSCLNNFLM